MVTIGGRRAGCLIEQMRWIEKEGESDKADSGETQARQEANGRIRRHYCVRKRAREGNETDLDFCCCFEGQRGRAQAQSAWRVGVKVVEPQPKDGVVHERMASRGCPFLG